MKIKRIVVLVIGLMLIASLAFGSATSVIDVSGGISESTDANWNPITSWPIPYNGTIIVDLLVSAWESDSPAMPEAASWRIRATIASVNGTSTGIGTIEKSKQNSPGTAAWNLRLNNATFEEIKYMVIEEVGDAGIPIKWSMFGKFYITDDDAQP
jgi:hypothetical protein